MHHQNVKTLLGCYGWPVAREYDIWEREALARDLAHDLKPISDQAVAVIIHQQLQAALAPSPSPAKRKLSDTPTLTHPQPQRNHAQRAVALGVNLTLLATAEMCMHAASASIPSRVLPDAPSEQQLTPDPRKVVTPLVPAKIEAALCKYGILSNWIYVLYSISNGFDVGIRTVPPQPIIFSKITHLATSHPISFLPTSETSRRLSFPTLEQF